MRTQIAAFMLVFAALTLPGVAQDKGQGGEGEQVVDQSKLLVGQLWELSDPATQKEVLMPLYNTLREVEVSQGGLGLDLERPKQQPNMLSLLNNKAVREEIGMQDYQYEELRQRTTDLRRSISQEVRAVMKSGERDPRKLTELIREIKERGERQMDQAVLPHQLDRLRQVGYQTMIRSRDPVDVITSEPFASELGLDEKEKERLREKSDELKEEYNRKVEALRRETVKKLFDELDKDQRKKVEELLGDEFDLAAFQRAAEDSKRAKTGTPKKRD